MPSAGAVRAPGGHLDQRIGPALPAVTGQLVEPGPSAQSLGGLGAVGLEELVLQPVQLAGHDGTRDRVERHLAEPHPREARLEIHVARRPAVLVGGVGALGVGQLLPVVQCPEEVLEAHGGGLGDQHLLVAGHGGLGAVAPGRGDRPGLVGPDPALPPGLGAVGQVAQRPPEADPAPGGAAGDPAAGGDPRRGRLGPVGRPLLAHLEGGGRLGHEGLEASELVVEHLDRRAVAVVLGAARHQRVERLGEVVQLHASHGTTRV